MALVLAVLGKVAGYEQVIGAVIFRIFQHAFKGVLHRGFILRVLLAFCNGIVLICMIEAALEGIRVNVGIGENPQVYGGFIRKYRNGQAAEGHYKGKQHCKYFEFK